MSTDYDVSREGSSHHFKVNGQLIARVEARRVDPGPGLAESGAPYFDADGHREAMDSARAIALAYTSGYDTGREDSAIVTVERARVIADEQIKKALDGLKVEVKR